jgi:negative regulator of genetic competence, sporulation and motility
VGKLLLFQITTEYQQQQQQQQQCLQQQQQRQQQQQHQLRQQQQYQPRQQQQQQQQQRQQQPNLGNRIYYSNTKLSYLITYKNFIFKFKVQCLYCFKAHWIVNCPEIPKKYQGYCIKCWRSTKHQARECPNNKRAAPWK